MNTKQKAKIDLLLGGFSSLYGDNSAYFEKLTWTAVSGRKEYCGSAKTDDGEFVLSFAGTERFSDIDALIDRLSSLIITYDRVVIEYHQRGGGRRIIADDRNVKMESFETKDDVSVVNGLKDKEYNIDLAKAAGLLKLLGFMTEDGKIKNDMIRKYNQTDRFLDLIDDAFDGMNNMTIVDCACGKSYLSFILNYYLWEKRRIKANFVGIDIKANVIEESRKIAEAAGYRNMTFVNADLREYNEVRPDAVISLHACDTATDMALGYAIRNEAKSIICIPCCHKELLDKYKMPQLDGIIEHGIFRARLNDILTDGLRCMKLEACGYKVSCVEYCSPLDTPKNIMIKARKVSDGNAKADAEYRKLLSALGVMPSIEIYSAYSDYNY